MSITAIVTVDKYVKNPKNAIKSILKTRDRFSALFIVDPLYDEILYYDEFVADIEDLRNSKIDVQICSSLCEDIINTKYVLNMPPNCVLTTFAIENLQQQTKRLDKTKTQFALNTGVKLKGWSFFYGYMLVVSFIYFIWNKWEQGKLYKHTDITMSSVIVNGRYRYIAKPNINDYLSYITKYNISRIVIPENQKICVVKPKTTGFNYVYGFLNNSQYLKLNWFYWIPYIRFWTLVFGVYWILNVLIIQQCFKLIITRGSNIYLPFTQIMFLLSFLFWIITVYSTARFLSVKHMIIMSLLNVFWVFTFPVFLIFCRTTNFNENWN